MARRHKLRQVDSSAHKSAITNAARILDGVDQRLAPARRYRDIISDIAADLGGVDNLTTAQMQLARTAAGLCVMRESHESDLLNGKSVNLDAHIKITNSLNRVLATLGLHRQSRDTTPDLDNYLRERGQHRKPNGHRNGRVRIAQ